MGNTGRASPHSDSCRSRAVAFPFSLGRSSPVHDQPSSVTGAILAPRDVCRSWHFSFACSLCKCFFLTQLFLHQNSSHQINSTHIFPQYLPWPPFSTRIISLERLNLFHTAEPRRPWPHTLPVLGVKALLSPSLAFSLTEPPLKETSRGRTSLFLPSKLSPSCPAPVYLGQFHGTPHSYISRPCLQTVSFHCLTWCYKSSLPGNRVTWLDHLLDLPFIPFLLFIAMLLTMAPFPPHPPPPNSPECAFQGPPTSHTPTVLRCVIKHQELQVAKRPFSWPLWAMDFMGQSCFSKFSPTFTPMTPICPGSPISGGSFSVFSTDPSLSPSFPQSTFFNPIKAKSHNKMNGGSHCEVW